MLNRLIAIVLAIVLIAFGFVWFSGKTPSVKVVQPIGSVGAQTSVTAEADSASGLKSFSAVVEQNGQSQTVFEDKNKSRQASRTFTFPIGKQKVPFLKEGEAKLTLSAASNDFRGRTATASQNFTVILRPPTIVADGRQHYINQGGAELVRLDLGGSWTDAGVHVTKYTAGTFPMPGQPEDSAHRFSLFPFPWDVSPDTIPLAFAKNSAGTEVTTTFWTKVFPKKFRESSIPLTDRELQKVVGELDPDGSGSLVERFVKLNRDMRKSNAQQIYDLRNNTEHKMLWSGPFVPIKGARESYFADRRSYIYNGKKVDEQVHLGYDLAQTTNMPVTAANAGKVIYADRLGIYGNCVILDHGYSLESLYGHMSRIEVKVGDTVQKNQQIGISGSTGMAFGDHVHFSMLIAGYQVDPKEWWDEHWIHDRILSKIGPNPTGYSPAATGESSRVGRPAYLHKKRRG